MLLFDDFEDSLPLALPVEGWIEEVDVFAYLSQRNSRAKSGFHRHCDNQKLFLAK